MLYDDATNAYGSGLWPDDTEVYVPSSLLDTNAWLPARRRLKGTLWTDHVSGRMTSGERDARLRRLTAEKAEELLDSAVK